MTRRNGLNHDAHSGDLDRDDLDIAVLVPCRNEAVSVGEVVRGFRTALPGCTVYVYDNCSTDDTSRVAREAGAVVRYEHRPGKGNVVQRMFNDIDADVYVMVDGDDTYDPADAPAMVDRLVHEQLDMVTGVRHAVVGESETYRRGHTWGNRLFSAFVRHFFGPITSDVLSGYRVLSRRFVKSFPAQARGFEIEIEMTAHAADVWAPCGDYPSAYRSRKEGSSSKLRTYRDGWRLAQLSATMLKTMRPLAFFGAITVLLSLIATVISLPVVNDYVRTGLVPRYPTWMLALAVLIVAFISLMAGVIADTVCTARREAKRLVYLAQPSTASLVRRSLRLVPLRRQVGS